MTLSKEDIAKMKKLSGLREKKEKITTKNLPLDNLDKEKDNRSVTVPDKPQPFKRLLMSSMSIQDELTNDSKGFNYTYCSIQKLIKVSRKHLTKNGLALFQTIEQGSNTVIVTKIMDMLNGEKVIETSRISLPSIETGQSKMSPYQIVGSGITYFRRYSIYAILCIQPDEDLDGKYEKEPTKGTYGKY